MSWFELELCKTSGILHKIVLKETALWHQCQLEKMITHWSWGFAFSHIQLCPLQKSCKLIDLELQPGHQNCGPWSFCISPTHWNISLPRLINETKFTKDQNVMQIQKQFVEWAYLSWNTISLRTTLVPTKQANLWCRISRGTRALGTLESNIGTTCLNVIYFWLETRTCHTDIQDLFFLSSHVTSKTM